MNLLALWLAKSTGVPAKSSKQSLMECLKQMEWNFLNTLFNCQNKVQFSNPAGELYESLCARARTMYTGSCT